MKACSEKGCTNPPFNEYCRYHQFRLYMKGGRLYKPKPRQTKPISKESPKRKEEKKTYKQVKDEIRAELIAQGKYNCFFCTKPMKREKGFHHIKGRDGQNFIDKRYLVPAHNQCHVDGYHQAMVEKLLQQPWYQGFLTRLRAIDEKEYRIEMKKQDKGILFSENNLVDWKISFTFDA